MKSVFAFAALFAAYAAAQTTTSSAAPPVSTGDISPCVLTCSTQAAQSAGCAGITDVECLCGSMDFQQAALTCLQTQCPNEVAAATALQSQLCGASGTGTSTATDTATETDTDTEATGTPSSSVPTGTATVPATGTATTSATTRPTTVASTSRASTVTSGTPTASSANSASVAFDFAATGAWAAAALGGAVVAQLVL
ncbi:hypothetical protein BN14_03285 [Rhizoctonia solani AG-1 IB]|uniref:CFEM domain-containing protein n=2 Tax=Rhizoctonia solani TaxID=456999 RepID=A0A8H3AH38_9AGAM|nr:unnamed protein product [Rhizoctonia solani]CCO29277.1 hypothetical protein BN14_03285 [Rhizoctonia solani AG-1 IB]